MTNKYNARKTEIDGITFDSLAESRRYAQLKLMAYAGTISELRTHPLFVIWEGIDPKGKKQKIEYEGDFSYIENGEQVVEDVKGVLTDVFKLKRKMFTCRYPGIKFVEINERRRS